MVVMEVATEAVVMEAAMEVAMEVAARCWWLRACVSGACVACA